MLTSELKSKHHTGCAGGASSSWKALNVQLETTKREQGDTAQGSDTMSCTAETLEGARADGGTRKEGRTKSDARTDWPCNAASGHEWKASSGAHSGCSLLDAESCDSSGSAHAPVAARGEMAPKKIKRI